MSENNKKKIAVVEFSDLQGNIVDIGRYLSEELITSLFQTHRFTVIERHCLTA
jgi:TolB-like protein